MLTPLCVSFLAKCCRLGYAMMRACFSRWLQTLLSMMSKVLASNSQLLSQACTISLGKAQTAKSDAIFLGQPHTGCLPMASRRSLPMRAQSWQEHFWARSSPPASRKNRLHRSHFSAMCEDVSGNVVRQRQLQQLISISVGLLFVLCLCFGASHF